MLLKPKFPISLFHGLFKVLPQSTVGLFGNCKETCGALALEDDFHHMTSLKALCHISVCCDCWNYYHQMVLVDQKIQQIVEKQNSETRYEDAINALIKRYS